MSRARRRPGDQWVTFHITVRVPVGSTRATATVSKSRVGYGLGANYAEPVLVAHPTVPAGARGDVLEEWCAEQAQGLLREAYPQLF